MPETQSKTAIASALATMEKRRAIQEMHEEEFQQALVAVKERIQDVEGSDIKERMQDQIRQWFIECRYRRMKMFFTIIRVSFYEVLEQCSVVV